MGDFSVEKALVSGFKVVGRNPLAIVAWAAVYLVVGVGPSLLIWSRLWPAMAAQSAHGGDPQATMAAMAGINGWVPLLWVLSLAVATVLYSAVYRAQLQPDDRGFFYLRLGRQELWMGLSLLALLLIFFVGGGIVAIAITLVGHSAPGIVTFLAVVAALVGFVWLAMRFSLTTPMAFAERRFVFLESWALTQGHALKLFGLALALVAMILGLELAISIPLMVVLSVTGVFRTNAAAAANPAAMLQHATPWIIVASLVGSLFVAACYAIMAAPWASIYQQLTAGAPSEDAV